MRIGKHDWRCIVYEEDDALGRTLDGTWTRGYTRRYTRYEWRRAGDLRWNPQREWPTYDGAHCDGSMPRSLARLYYRHQDAIQSALGREPVQPSLLL